MRGTLATRGLGAFTSGRHRQPPLGEFSPVSLQRKIRRRHITAIDADASAFIRFLFNSSVFSTATTSQPEKRLISWAIDDLVKQMKLANLWTKCTAIYPMVGESLQATSFLWGNSLNLKSPTYQNASFPISWSGSVAPIGSELGVSGNTNCFPDTGLNIRNVIGSFDWHIAGYCKTEGSTATMCVFSCGSGALNPGLRCPSGTGIELNANAVNINVTTDHRCGFIVGTRVSTTSMSLYKNGYLIGSSSTLTGTGLTNGTEKLQLNFTGGAGTEPMTMPLAFASIGSGLSDSDVSDYSSIVNRFQARLGRLV